MQTMTTHGLIQLKMALVLGTNCGFVTVAPVADPDGSSVFITNYAVVSKHTSPANANKITEIGWWSDIDCDEANFEVGLYATDGAVVPGEAGTLLYVDRINVKGATAGWKRVTVDWSISGSTDYWLAVQVDQGNLVSAKIDYTSTGFYGEDYRNVDSLPDPFGGGAIDGATASDAIYAVWEEEEGTTRQVKISGSFVEKPYKIKIDGTFVDKPVKVKVGGNFQ